MAQSRIALLMRCGNHQVGTRVLASGNRIAVARAIGTNRKQASSAEAANVNQKTHFPLLPGAGRVGGTGCTRLLKSGTRRRRAVKGRRNRAAPTNAISVKNSLPRQI